MSFTAGRVEVLKSQVEAQKLQVEKSASSSTQSGSIPAGGADVMSQDIGIVPNLR
jgi:hypothetical protein